MARKLPACFTVKKQKPLKKRHTSQSKAMHRLRIDYFTHPATYPFDSASRAEEKHTLFCGLMRLAQEHVGKWYLFEFRLPINAHACESVGPDAEEFEGATEPDETNDTGDASFAFPLDLTGTACTDEAPPVSPLDISPIVSPGAAAGDGAGTRMTTGSSTRSSPTRNPPSKESAITPAIPRKRSVFRPYASRHDAAFSINRWSRNCAISLIMRHPKPIRKNPQAAPLTREEERDILSLLYLSFPYGTS